MVRERQEIEVEAIRRVVIPSPDDRVDRHLTSLLHVALSGLSLADGDNNNGAGIYNLGMLTLTACTLSGNSAAIGGGIDNEGAATVPEEAAATVKLEEGPDGFYHSRKEASAMPSFKRIRVSCPNCGHKITAPNKPGHLITSGNLTFCLIFGSSGTVRPRYKDEIDHMTAVVRIPAVLDGFHPIKPHSDTVPVKMCPHGTKPAR
jgi:hypothetical protein